MPAGQYTNYTRRQWKYGIQGAWIGVPGKARLRGFIEIKQAVATQSGALRRVPWVTDFRWRRVYLQRQVRRCLTGERVHDEDAPNEELPADLTAEQARDIFA